MARPRSSNARSNRRLEGSSRGGSGSPSLTLPASRGGLSLLFSFFPAKCFFPAQSFFPAPPLRLAAGGRTRSSPAPAWGGGLGRGLLLCSCIVPRFDALDGGLSEERSTARHPRGGDSGCSFELVDQVAVRRIIRYDADTT